MSDRSFGDIVCAHDATLKDLLDYAWELGNDHWDFVEPALEELIESEENSEETLADFDRFLKKRAAERGAKEEAESME